MGANVELPRECLRCREIETFCGCDPPIFDVVEYVAFLEKRQADTKAALIDALKIIGTI